MLFPMEVCLADFDSRMVKGDTTEPLRLTLTPYNPLANVRSEGQLQVSSQNFEKLFTPLLSLAKDSSSMPSWWLESFESIYSV